MKTERHFYFCELAGQVMMRMPKVPQSLSSLNVGTNVPSLRCQVSAANSVAAAWHPRLGVPDLIPSSFRRRRKSILVILLRNVDPRVGRDDDVLRTRHTVLMQHRFRCTSSKMPEYITGIFYATSCTKIQAKAQPK
ncbi:hypothetical protein [Collimonas sp.]|uniref:hypothetical protein n=1 Tax=Collimonas sp. TaxID=1963772 RepID=UPI0037C16023